MHVITNRTWHVTSFDTIAALACLIISGTGTAVGQETCNAGHTDANISQAVDAAACITTRSAVIPNLGWGALINSNNVVGKIGTTPRGTYGRTQYRV